jgi:hypothetical protein
MKFLVSGFFVSSSAVGMFFSGIEETKPKYCPPSLQCLCRSGQPSMPMDLRAGSRWRRPCGNSFMPGHLLSTSTSREVSLSIPSGSACSPRQELTDIFLSFGRFPRFEGSATNRGHQKIFISSRDVGNFGISSKLSQHIILNLSSWGS